MSLSILHETEAIPIPFDNWVLFYKLPRKIYKVRNDWKPYGVSQNENILSYSTRQKILDGAAALEPLGIWYGPNHTTLGLIDPAMYCYVFGVTPLLRLEYSHELDLSLGQDFKSPQLNPRKLFVLPKVENPFAAIWNPDQSNKYQMIPTDFVWSGNGSNNNSKVKLLSYINNLHPGRFPELYAGISSALERTMPIFTSLITKVVSNFPSVYLPPNAPMVNTDLKNRRLQVFVSMENVHLTPDKPKFPGGHWHVEGMKNERIVASAIFYYDISNITESLLEFRVETPAKDGTENPIYQHLGVIRAEPNKVIVFPNIYQHRVAPFQLVDPTKPGHRKILTLFLVNPNTPVLSTAMIPPQQKDWYEQEDLAEIRGSAWPWSLDQALELYWGFDHERTHKDFVGPRQQNFEQVCHKD